MTGTRRGVVEDAGTGSSGSQVKPIRQVRGLDFIYIVLEDLGGLKQGVSDTI